MIAGLAELLRRHARAAPSAFREDPVFRYAAIGAVAALVMLPGRLGGASTNTPKPQGPPPPATVGRPNGAPAPQVAQPIAPGQSLNSLTAPPDRDDAPDDFGTLSAPPLQSRNAAE